MLELFVVGTFWFWILVFVSFVALFYQVNVGNGWGSTLVFIGTVAAVAILGNSTLFLGFLSYIKDNPGIIILCFAGYFIAGAVWSIVKWYYFVVDKRDEYLEYNRRSDFKIPSPKEYKSDIMLWMSYWPVSAVWTIINNPFKKIFIRIQKSLEGVYEKISAHVFKDLIKEKATK